MKYLFWVDQEKGYIKRFMILMNEKNVYQRVHQFDKSFWRVYHSTLIFFSDIGFLLYGSTSRPSPLSPLSLSNSFEVTDSPAMTSALFNFFAPQPEDDKSFGVTGNTGLRPVLNDLCIGRSPAHASPISNTFPCARVAS
jgi:hypothetical protein